VRLYDFDEVIERSNTACVKYDLRKMFFGTEEVIPMWVADMDFKTPQFILDSLKERASHPILGYSIRPPEYYDAIVNWLQRRHNWTIKPEWICFSPGIVPALNLAVLAFTKPGDHIIVQPPVYFPFFSAVSSNKRILSYNQLQMVNGRYQMDYKGLEKLCKKGASMIIISNPHNPGGNAWNADELQQMADICLRYDVLMVSDEIHADLVNVGFKHTVLASLGEAIAKNTITMTSASKTFNLAALSTASVIISNKKLLRVFNTLVQNLHVDMGNVFGTVATIAAYNQGEEWLQQLLQYINVNLNLLDQTLKSDIPEIKMIHPEATYMAWLDCTALNLDDKALEQFFIKDAGLGLNSGIQFGKGGSSYMRINLACPKAILEKALSQLKNAIIGFRN
jgi:cysteine-S-conjugate beta-lyase